MIPYRTVAVVAIGALGIYAADPDCSSTDNQSDAGSKIVRLGGDANHVFPQGSLNGGTYRTKAVTAAQKTGCRWRVYKAVNGKWRQTSPRTLGEWNRLGSVFHKGSVKIKPKAQAVMLQSRSCPTWEMRK